MLVSVVIPIHNVAAFLPRCIESMLSQTHCDFELLLVDDGSTDESLAICKCYACRDSRIKIFHQKNGGVSSARNLGLEKCQGEWVAFVDSDDYVATNYLSIMLDATIHRDTDLVISGFTRVDDSAKNIKLDSYTYANENISIEKLDIEQLKRITHWSVGVSKLFRSSIIKNNGLRFPPIAVKEDVVFLVSYLDCCKNICTIDGNAYYYVQRRGSALNHTYTFEERIDMQLKYSQQIKALKINSNMMRSYFEHDCPWVTISDTYYGCKSPLKRIKALKAIDVTGLNAQYLDNNRFKQFDTLLIALLKRRHYIAYDALKFTETSLIKCFSALIILKQLL